MSNIVVGLMLLFCALCFGWLSWSEIKNKNFDSIATLALFIVMGVCCLVAGCGVFLHL